MGVRDSLRAWLGGSPAADTPTPESAGQVSGMYTYRPTGGGVFTAELSEPEPLPPGQRRVHIPEDDVLTARGAAGYVAGFRQKLADPADRDPRPELARQAGYLGDVMFLPREID